MTGALKLKRYQALKVVLQQIHLMRNYRCIKYHHHFIYIPWVPNVMSSHASNTLYIRKRIRVHCTH